MRVTVERGLLAEALGRVGAAAARKGTIPIINNVLLEAGRDGLRLTATDLDLEISEAIEATNVAQKGALTVDAAMLADWVKSLPSGGEIGMTAEDAPGRLRLSCGRSRSALPTLPAGDFPTIQTGEPPFGGVIEAATLARLLALTDHAMSTDETRYVQQGVFLCCLEVDGAATLRAVSTDGQRLACVDVAMPEGFAPFDTGQRGVIVPAKTAKTMARLLDGAAVAELRMGESRISLSVGEATMGSKVIDGVFPDCERVIPKAPPPPTRLDTAVALAAVKRVAGFSDNKVRSLRLSLDGAGGATLEARQTLGSAEGAEQFDVSYRGEPRKMAFASRHLMDLLGLVTSQADFHFDAPGVPVLVTDAASPGVRHLLMPLAVG